MEEELNVDPQYLKGFNNGYLLSKHDPQLAAQLSQNPNEHNTYFQGLMGGKAEYDREVNEWAKSFSKGVPAKDDREQQKEK